MLLGIVIDVATTKQIHIVVKSTILFSEHSRYVCLTIATALNDLLQTKVGIQIETLLYQYPFNTVGNPFTSLLWNLFKFALCLYGFFYATRVRLLFSRCVVKKIPFAL